MELGNKENKTSFIGMLKNLKIKTHEEINGIY